jgi:thymidylate synthase (FAD)
MIERIKQSVEILPSISEEQMLSMFAHITATPYGNGVYDMSKTHKIVESCVLKGHFSILEHGHVALKCVTNIGTYKDFTRHRHCAFTIESTSFTKYGNNMQVITVQGLSDEEEKVLSELQKVYMNIQSIKIARDFIPQCCAATMVMTTNIREWRHIIGTRGDPGDNPLTRELRTLIWQALNAEYPFFFPLDDNTVGNPMCIYDTWGERKPCII